MPFRDGVCWLFLTSQDKNWEGEKFHFPNFFNMCALRRTFRLRAMGALSQVKVVCSKNKGCVGCQDGGCESHGWCKNYNCCKEKGLNGRWECSEFPFTGCMLDKPRIRAFAEFARRYRVRTVILHLFLTGIPRFNTISHPKALEARYKAHWRLP